MLTPPAIYNTTLTFIQPKFSVIIDAFQIVMSKDVTIKIGEKEKRYNSIMALAVKEMILGNNWNYLMEQVSPEYKIKFNAEMEQYHQLMGLSKVA